MLQVIHLAAGRSRGNAARLGLAALAAFTVLTMSAGASDALATYGTVKVKKVNVGGPAGDWFGFDRSTDLGGGSFSLQGGGTWSKQVLANWASGPYSGKVYTVTEPASDEYELKELSCKTYDRYGPRPDAGTVTSLAERRATIKVRYNETVECVFTNERVRTGTIVVKKDLVPATDAGRFGLQVDGVTKVADAGDGDASAPVKVRAGTHVVGETGADLDGYVRSTVCTKPGRYGMAEVASGGAGPLDVAVGDGDAVTCTIKNVRKAELIVEKHTAPADPAAPKTSFDFTVDPGATAFSLTDGGVESRWVEPGSAYTVTEADARAKGYKLTDVGCTTAYGDTARAIASAGSVATRSATVTPGPGDVVTCRFTNTKINPAIAVQKTGPATAYAGDTLTFDYVVTNPGNEPLHQVDVTDDRCAPVVEGAKDGADDVLDPGETWRYSCTMVAPPHAIGDPNPVVNTVTAEGLDGDGTKVQDHDTHATR
ncbi:MAG: serine-aspartate repeat-containing protein, partial [Solirubrobacteraceae bacterium]|nr:serine-aspartate repeat-containing protein [Solirubrobacteraceae bacterium]